MNQKFGDVVQNEYDKFVSGFSIADFLLLHHTEFTLCRPTLRPPFE